MTSIFVPVANGTNHVEIPLDEPMPPSSDLVPFLSEERAPLSVWLDVAIQYYKQNKLEDFKTILSYFTEGQMPDYYREDKSSLVALLNVFASYYLRQGRLANDKVQKHKLFNQAAQLFGRANGIDSKEEITWAGRAFCFLFRNEPGRAGDQFQALLDQNPNNIPALLGQATILFQNQKYNEACTLYKKVIKLNPDCPPSVRIGLANCYFKLNQMELCKLAFERVLELETDDDIRVEALVGLAVLAKNERRYDVLSKHVNEAIRLNSQHSKALNLVAGFYLAKGELSRCHRSASRAYNNTTMLKVQAESCYFLGRCYHAQGDFQTAGRYYQQSISKWGDFVLPQFGLGQMSIQQKDTPKAIKTFEKVLELSPDNYEAMKILGSLYASKGESEKAIGLLSKAVGHMPEDVEALLELAEVLETMDYKKSYSCYSQAIVLMKREGKVIPQEIWNNVGLLVHQLEVKQNYLKPETFYRRALLGNFGHIPDDEELDAILREAQEAHREARSQWNIISLLEGPERQQLLQTANVTTVYNLARLYEDVNDRKRATIIYKALIKEYPSYLDPHMRLAYMEYSLNRIEEGEKILRDVLADSHHSISLPPNATQEVLLAIANFNMKKKDMRKAQPMYEDIQKSENGHYSSLMIASIYLQSAILGSIDEERKAKCLKWAQDMYLRVLAKDKGNIYAANGLALLNIYNNRLAEGKECLLQMREACGTLKLPPIWLNLAHVNLLQKNYETAIRLYQTYIDTFGEDSDENIHLYLANAYFLSGNLPECKRRLSKALRLRPWDDELWYNLGITMHANAKQIIGSAKSNYAQLKAAIEDFKAALPILERLAALPASSKRSFNSRQCSKLCMIAKANIGEFEEKLKEAAGKEAEKLKQQESKLEVAERLKRERLLLLEKEEEERLNKQRQLEEEARELSQKRVELAQRWTERQERAAQQQVQKKTKKKAKPFVEGEHQEEDTDSKKRRRPNKGEKSEKSPKRRKLQSKSKKQAEERGEDAPEDSDSFDKELFGDEDEEEEGNVGEEAEGYEVRQLGDLFPEDDEEEGEEKEEGEEEDVAMEETNGQATPVEEER